MKKINCVTLIGLFIVFIMLKTALATEIKQALGSDSCLNPNASENKYLTRFVTLISPMSIGISQIACFNHLGFNVTFLKSVSASSVYDIYTSPSHLTDGNNLSRGYPDIFGTEDDKPGQVTIDLGKDYLIKKCIIYNRSDCCEERILNSRLQLLDANKKVVASSVITSQSKEIKVLFPNHRFIYLKASGDENKALQVSQIACYDKAGNNLTLGKPVVASSTLDRTSTSSVTDGILSTKSFPDLYHCDQDSNCDLTIDLGAAYEVNNCKYYNRAECCKERIIGARFEILSNDKKPVRSYVIQTGDDIIDIDATANVRYVKLKAASSGEKFLNLSQLACYDAAGNFVTKGKTVAASSVYSQNPGPQLITDGTLATRRYMDGFHCAEPNNCEISIDLGTSYNITKCVFYNREECCQDRIIGAKLTLQDFNNNVVRSYDFTTGDKVIEIKFN